MDTSVKTISIDLKRKVYEIIIGSSILQSINSRNELINSDRFVIIISTTVLSFYQDLINEVFGQYENYEIILMKDGEEFKNYRYAEDFFRLLLEKGYSRKSVIVSIGGGVVGDFAGFIASVYMRGIPVIHIPTTLLAMVDSSIGGKVAVNIAEGKNIVGAFHQPELVISDISFLKTLPDIELKNGLAETVKHALIGEAELLGILLDNDMDSIKKSEIMERIVYLSARYKSKIVERDEKEGGLRAILNFGHTVGHAIESYFEHRGITHGEAVAIGLSVEIKISSILGWLTEDEVSRFDKILNRYKLIYNDYRFDEADLIEHMRYDKKNLGGRINFVLLKGIGKPVYNQHVDESIVKEAIMSLKK